jgi:enoyl-CoA hydratase
MAEERQMAERRPVAQEPAPGAGPIEEPAPGSGPVEEPAPDAGLGVEERGPVLVLTIDRPAARNALTRAVGEAILDGYARLDASPDLRVAVLTGAGGYFCAGMDLKAFADGDRPDDATVRRMPDKPVIAAIEGFALAGGLELALSCDLIVAARGARLGIPEVRVGVAAAGGGLTRLPRRLPYHVAMELALTGAPITADRAAELGLVNRLAEPGAALDEALALAEVVATNAPLGVRASTDMVRASAYLDEPQLWSRQALAVDPVFDTADALEGARAFAEKRAPRWSGA